jgi:hypothetical protein
VVPLSESSELLNTLISILYPVPTVIPNSYEKVFICLRMSVVITKSFITRCCIYLRRVRSTRWLQYSRYPCRGQSRGTFPVPKGAEAFTAYAIASAKGLTPEMENAAHLTLDHPMTFESLGEGLRLFEGGRCGTLSTSAGAAETNLSRASTHICWRLREHGLVAPKLYLLRTQDKSTLFLDG